MVEMASRAARKLANNLDEKKVLSSDCTIFFAWHECDIDAHLEGAASVGTGGLSGIGNPPTPVTKSRRDSQLAASLEGDPGPIPAGKTLPHSFPETRFRRERERYDSYLQKNIQTVRHAAKPPGRMLWKPASRHCSRDVRAT